MSTKVSEDTRRSTARRQSALVPGITQGNTAVAEARRAYDLWPSEVESRVEDGRPGMENTMCANAQDVKE
nr:transposase [Paraburkholderia tropica]